MVGSEGWAAMHGGQRRRRTLSGFSVAVLLAMVLGGCVPPDSSLGSERPRSCVPRIGTNQIVLPLPGLFLPLPSIRGLSEFEDLDPAPSEANLPSEVDLRDNSGGFNSYAEFALAEGSLYTRPRRSGAQWRKVPTPGCLDGHIVAVSVDSNMAVALDSDGWIYSLDNLLSGPLLWNWTRSYGAPIWLWPGMKVPAEALAPGKWAISHRMSESFVDAKGYKHPTTAGLVQLVSLAGDGSRIVYQDPWLPPDFSYEIGGPVRGRFISEAITGSGSVTFVMNRYGDMYTRKYDLDLAGSNHIPGRYTWQEQGDLPSAPNQFEERTNSKYAAISLPAEDWRHQPKIPGDVTSRISISQTGPTMEDRELRVEGRSVGRSGYWRKDLVGADWEFMPVDGALRNPVLSEADPAVDQSSLTLAAPTGLTFSGEVGGGWTLRTEDFDWAQTKRDATLTAPSGTVYPIRIYTTDALRLDKRSPGLSRTPRTLEGAIDVRPAEPWAVDNADLAGFVRSTLAGKDIYEIVIQATSDKLVVTPDRLFAPTLATLRQT